MNLKKMRLEAWIFLLTISYRGNSIVHWWKGYWVVNVSHPWLIYQKITAIARGLRVFFQFTDIGMATSNAEALKDPAALLALCQVTFLFTIINSIIPCNIITIIVVILEVPPFLVGGESLRLLLQGAQRRIFVSCHLHGEVITITIIITRPKPAYGRQGLAGSWG